MIAIESLRAVVANRSLNLNQILKVEVSNQPYEAYLWRVYREFTKLPELQQCRLWEEWMSDGFLMCEYPSDWGDPDYPLDFIEDQGALWEFWLDTREMSAADWADFLVWVTRKAIAEGIGIEEIVH